MTLYLNNEKLQVIIGGQKYKMILPIVSDFVQVPILIDGKIIGYFTAQTPTANTPIYGGLVEVK